MRGLSTVIASSSLRERLKLALVAGLAVALSSCVIAGEAELPDLEVVNSGITIPAAPPEADGSEVALTVAFQQKPNRAGLASNSFQDVHVNAVTVVATAGISDLSFVRSLRILASNPTAPAAKRQAPVEIARYQRKAGEPVGRSIEIPNTPPANVTDLWKSDEVTFTLEVAGQMPSVPWTADVGLRVGAIVTY